MWSGQGLFQSIGIISAMIVFFFFFLWFFLFFRFFFRLLRAIVLPCIILGRTALFTERDVIPFGPSDEDDASQKTSQGWMLPSGDMSNNDSFAESNEPRGIEFAGMVCPKRRSMLELVKNGCVPNKCTMIVKCQKNRWYYA